MMVKLTVAGLKIHVHYIPVVCKPYYMTHFFSKKGDFLNLYAYNDKVLSIPYYSALDDEDIQKVIATEDRIIR